jgi:hypothetical protein
MHHNADTLVVVLSARHQTVERGRLRDKFASFRMLFFVGLTTNQTVPKTHMSCLSDYAVPHWPSPLSSRGTGEAHDDVVVVPVVDSYHNLGRKVVHAFRWVVPLSFRVLLYMDMDYLESMSTDHLSRIARRVTTAHDRSTVLGEILDCLTVVNQYCCCASHLALSVAHFYRQTRDLGARLPPLLYGGSGMGFTRQAHVAMMRVATPSIHYSSDHTLSQWARDAGVSFVAGNWSDHRWCESRSPLQAVTRVANYTWKCANGKVVKGLYDAVHRHDPRCAVASA